MNDDANVDLFIITILELSVGIFEEKSTRIMIYAYDGLFMNV